MQKTEHLTKKVSQRLNALRAGDDSTQRQLAESIGIPLAVLNRTITAKGTPSPDALVKMAQFYGVSVDWLLGLSDSKPRRKRQAAS